MYGPYQAFARYNLDNDVRSTLAIYLEDRVYIEHEWND